MVRKKMNRGPVMDAAERALETGNAHHILIWIPEEYENTLKNLLERVCCERNANKAGHCLTADWYFRMVSRLHSASRGQENLDISIKTPEEKKIIFLIAGACESGNFEEINAVITDTPTGEMQQRFNDIMLKRAYGVENIAAGRAYVSAFTGFIAWVKNLHAGSHQGQEK
jgi:hypothetical protein